MALPENGPWVPSCEDQGPWVDAIKIKEAVGGPSTCDKFLFFNFQLTGLYDEFECAGPLFE